MNNDLKRILEKNCFINDENKKYLEDFSAKETNFYIGMDMTDNLEFTLENLGLLDIDKSPREIIISFHDIVKLFKCGRLMEKYFKILNKHKIPFILVEVVFFQVYGFETTSWIIMEAEEYLEQLNKETVFPEKDEDKKLFFEHQKEILKLFFDKHRRTCAEIDAIKSFIDCEDYKTENLDAYRFLADVLRIPKTCIKKYRYLVDEARISPKYTRQFWISDASNILKKIYEMYFQIWKNKYFLDNLEEALLSQWYLKWYPKKINLSLHELSVILFVLFIERLNLDQELFESFLSLIVNLEKQSGKLDVKKILEDVIQNPLTISSFSKLVLIV